MDGTDLLGHQDVVRDLSFAPNGSPILVSASRDKTLRVWDLSRDGRNMQGYPCAGALPWDLPRESPAQCEFPLGK
uniref:Coronin n=1 Tax=Catharus ustulatus TaxID=91951 RepID=A0A8C3VFC2_CATUS